MPHIVELDLTASDFRQFYRPDNYGDAQVTPEPHWLLHAVYGRDLLKAKLRKARAEETVPAWRHAAELDPQLEEMVDLLGLRSWPEPKSVAAKVRYLRLVLAMAVAVDNDKPLPRFAA